MEKQPVKTNPKENANIVSRLLICWLYSLLRLGSQRQLTQDDLFELADEDQAEYIVQDFEEVWQEEIISAKSRGNQPRLWKAMARFFNWSDYFWLLFWKIIEVGSIYCRPVLLWFFLKTLQEDEGNRQYYLALGAVGIGAISFMFTFRHQYHIISRMMGMRLTIACTGLIQQKILKSSRVHLSNDKPGHVFNLVSNDIQRLGEFVQNVQYNTAVIIGAPISFALLCTLIRWQAITGAFFIIICGISQIFLAQRFAYYRLLQASATDQRLSAVNEIIKGIRTVKMHAWEWSYLDVISGFRRKEMTLARSKTFFLSITAFLYTIMIIFAIATSVFTLILSGFYLDAMHFFVLLSILQNFGDSTMIQISGTLFTYDNLSSIKRIETFLLNNKRHSEQDEDKITRTTKMVPFTFRKQSPKYTLLKDAGEPNLTVKEPFWNDNNINSSSSVNMVSANSGWDEDESTLHNISLRAESNTLVMVTGSVGSGKSTLLMTILQEVPVRSGQISVIGKIAYVSQIPWIFTGTVRENILFGKSFDQARYERVLEACDLNPDISKFPKGDQSMIGQRGVMLSGGQRARVALARAVYSDADIVLLDDPLSAVDAKVGEHILDNCICGELSMKIRILATHQLQHLRRADQVVILKEGGIIFQGSYKDLSKNQALDELIGEFKDPKSATSKPSSVHPLRDEADADRGIDLLEEKEDIESGSISWRLYWSYFRLGLPCGLVVCLGFFVAAALACPFVSFWWLKVMSTMSHEEQKGSYALGIYGGLLAANLIVPFLEVLFMLLALLRSSEKIHEKMTMSVLKSPVTFFDTNPVGRIINRFSKDISIMDDSLPMQFVFSAITIGTFLVASVSIGVINYWYFFVTIPAVMVFIFLCRTYLKPARDLYRLEALRCSSVYDHVSETMEGLEVIHSSHMEDKNMLNLHSLQNNHTRALSLTIAIGRALGFHVDLLCALCITLVAAGAILLQLDPGTTGLVLAISMTVIGNTGYGIQMFSDMETFMVSVERVMKYTQLPSEPGYDRKGDPPQDWPSEGALVVKDLSLKYFKGGACVLDDINFRVKSHERIGIAGRTGAGKSSLVAALFRMPDPQGSVIIDGVDLGTLNIQAARRSIAVIAQNPILFSGSLKHSLDPFHHFTEEQIWAALDVVQMKERVGKLEGLLEYSIGDSGSGFSVGETQLLCLARAILQRCKVLVLDEATANVDYKTDQLVQQVIREKFSHCTVLTIAHRLNTIMDYDRVLVLDRGHVVEYDKPEVLAAKADGVFAKLLKSQHGSNIS